jgi:hypothetical protein
MLSAETMWKGTCGSGGHLSLSKEKEPDAGAIFLKWLNEKEGASVCSQAIYKVKRGTKSVPLFRRFKKWVPLYVRKEQQHNPHTRGEPSYEAKKRREERGGFSCSGEECGEERALRERES